MTDFFEISFKIERSPFYYQNFPDPLLITALSFACSRRINKCKESDICEVEKYQPMKKTLENFC